MNNNQGMNNPSSMNSFNNNQPYPQNNGIVNGQNNNQMPNNNFMNQQVQTQQPSNFNQTNSNVVNPFANNYQVNNPVNQGYTEMLKQEGINVQNQSRFINNNTFNETSINDLNIEGDYNNLNRIDYRNDPKVMENLGQVQKEKKTITITKELKFVIMVALGLFLFIFIMPYIFDFFRDING